jgi:hypothetical protein
VGKPEDIAGCEEENLRIHTVHEDNSRTSQDGTRKNQDFIWGARETRGCRRMGRGRPKDLMGARGNQRTSQDGKNKTYGFHRWCEENLRNLQDGERKT